MEQSIEIFANFALHLHICRYGAASNRCADYGDGYRNGKTANEACCVCNGGSTTGPGPTGPVTIEFRNKEDPDYCIDVKVRFIAQLGTQSAFNHDRIACGGSSQNLFFFTSLKYGSTVDGNVIWHYKCNGSPAQQFTIDSNNYIRSKLDNNKCLVGSGGQTTSANPMIINTCFANDNRFRFEIYEDGTIRPTNNQDVCVGPSKSRTIDGVFVMQFYDCYGGNHQQWTRPEIQGRRRMLQETETVCSDTPDAWYDYFNRNCLWYAEDNRCEEYGSLWANFGKTANQACCVCGGGSELSSNNDDPPAADFPEVDNADSCWDTPNWYDTASDSCEW